jgi:hypothetical protein
VLTGLAGVGDIVCQLITNAKARRSAATGAEPFSLLRTVRMTVHGMVVRIVTALSDYPQCLRLAQCVLQCCRVAPILHALAWDRVQVNTTLYHIFMERLNAVRPGTPTCIPLLRLNPNGVSLSLCLALSLSLSLWW